MVLPLKWGNKPDWKFQKLNTVQYPSKYLNIYLAQWHLPASEIERGQVPDKPGIDNMTVSPKPSLD